MLDGHLVIYLFGHMNGAIERLYAYMHIFLKVKENHHMIIWERYKYDMRTTRILLYLIFCRIQTNKCDF